MDVGMRLEIGIGRINGKALAMVLLLWSKLVLF